MSLEPKSENRPARKGESGPAFLRRPLFGASPVSQYLIVLVVMAGLTLSGFVFEPLLGSHPTALIFLLVVVMLALFVGRGPMLLAAIMSALLWDFCFLPPLYAFHVHHLEDAILLCMYFVVALVLGQLTSRIRSQEQVEREREERSTALFLLTRDLNEAKDPDQLLEHAAIHLDKIFQAKIAVLLPDRTRRLKRYPQPANAFTIDDQDRETAARVFKDGHWVESAGHVFFFPLSANNEIHGVIGLRFIQPITTGSRLWDLLEAFIGQIALALDRHRLREFSEKTKLLTESERLSKTLLNSISHEIRTPIAAIKSAAGNLVEFKDSPLSSSQQEMVREIQEATDRLNRLVGNVLEITRLESGRVKPKVNLCDVRDLIQVAVKDTKKELAGHKVAITIASDLPLVQMDFVLTQQALHNLLSNAAFHTPPGTAVEVSAKVAGDSLVITVADNGPGIPAESISRIFDKFYRDPAALAGGIGLGLSVVRGLVTAQGGQILVKNRSGGGASFTILLPLRKNSFTLNL